MNRLQGIAPARARRVGFVGLALAGLSAAGALGRADEGSSPGAAAEHYALPITAPLDQGDTGLCWVYATLSMLETNYMSRHPGVQVEFSRAALQRDAVADRLRRLARGEASVASDGGLAVEALELVRRNGLIERGDFHDVVDARPLLAALTTRIAGDAEPARKEQAIGETLAQTLGAPPPVTHLEGRPVSPAALANAALAGKAWTEYDVSPDGGEGIGPSRDPDARPETRVRYAPLDRLIGLIHASLARGEAVVVGTADHAFLVYGADYDHSGKPVAYLVKDSLAPYLYRLDADDLHGRLNDVTVALDGPPPSQAKADRPRTNEGLL